MTQLSPISESQQEERKHKIMNALMDGLTHQEIADKLRCSRSTIERDLSEITNDTNMLSFFKTEWLKRYGLRIKTNPNDVEAFRALTSLIKRSGDSTITQNIANIRVTFAKEQGSVESDKIIDTEAIK